MGKKESDPKPPPGMLRPLPPPGPPKPSIQRTEYIFTFGCGQLHENGYHAIKAESRSVARKIMIGRFGIKWSMQYDSREQAGVDRWQLKEIKWEGNQNGLNQKT